MTAHARTVVRRSRAGTILAMLVLSLAACGNGGNGEDGGDGPRVLELNADTVRLPDSIRVATVRIDRTKRDEFEPGHTNIRVSDVVRFISSDAGSHAIAFDGDAMSADARAFLDASGQMRSPPFLAAGSAWVMNFSDAPPGSYPFRCPTHGVRGTITVASR